MEGKAEFEHACLKLSRNGAELLCMQQLLSLYRTGPQR